MESAKINGAQHDFKILKRLSDNFSTGKNVTQDKASGIFFKMTGKHNVAVQSVEKGKWLPWKNKDYKSQRDFETSTAFVKGLVENVLRHKDDFTNEQLGEVFTFIEKFNDHVANRAEEIYKTKDVGEKVELLSIRDIDIALADLTSDFSRICNENVAFLLKTEIPLKDKNEIVEYVKKAQNGFKVLYNEAHDNRFKHLEKISTFVHKFEKEIAEKLNGFPHEIQKVEIDEIQGALFQCKMVLYAAERERSKDIEVIIKFLNDVKNNLNKFDKFKLKESIEESRNSIQVIIREYAQKSKLSLSREGNVELHRVIDRLKDVSITPLNLSTVLEDFRELFQLINKRQF